MIIDPIEQYRARNGVLTYAMIKNQDNSVSTLYENGHQERLYENGMVYMSEGCEDSYDLVEKVPRFYGKGLPEMLGVKEFHGKPVLEQEKTREYIKNITMLQEHNMMGLPYEETQEMSQDVTGTPSFISPEQWEEIKSEYTGFSDTVKFTVPKEELVFDRMVTDTGLDTKAFDQAVERIGKNMQKQGKPFEGELIVGEEYEFNGGNVHYIVGRKPTGQWVTCNTRDDLWPWDEERLRSAIKRHIPKRQKIVRYMCIDTNGETVICESKKLADKLMEAYALGVHIACKRIEIEYAEGEFDE